MPACRPYAEAIADLLDPQGGLFHRVIANSASTDKDGMPVDQLKSFSRVRGCQVTPPTLHTNCAHCITLWVATHEEMLEARARCACSIC